MARKIKIPNHIKKRHDRTEFSRIIENKTKRKYFLIVCEGEKTEPNYFKSLKNALPKGVLEVCEFNIDGTGYNTESLVNKSIEIKATWEENLVRKIDKLWVVFYRIVLSLKHLLVQFKSVGIIVQLLKQRGQMKLLNFGICCIFIFIIQQLVGYNTKT